MGQPAQQVLEYLLVWIGPASIGEIYGIFMESLTSGRPTATPTAVAIVGRKFRSTFHLPSTFRGTKPLIAHRARRRRVGQFLHILVVSDPS